MAPREKHEEMMIVNRRTGKALQSTGLENGQVVEQAAPSGSDAQLWIQVKAGKAVKLVNKASGKVLDVTHGSTESGAWAQTWEDVGGESQLWQWVKVTAAYKKLMNVQSGKVLDIVDMREDDGAPAQIWDDVEGVGQQWKLVFSATEEKAPAPAEEEPAKPVRKKPGPKPKAKVAEAAAPAVEAVEEAAPKEVEAEPARKKPGPKTRTTRTKK